MIVRSRTFEQLLAFLRHNCVLLNLNDETVPPQQSSDLPRIVVTFDDGWKDTCEIAAPLAAQYEIPIAIFVCPGLTDKVSPFWPEQVIRAWKRARESSGDAEKLSALILEFFPDKRFVTANWSSHGDLDTLISCIKHSEPSRRDRFVAALTKLVDTFQASNLESTMNWEDVEHMRNSGFAIGSHSDHHEILPRLTTERAQREISDSKNAIEATLGTACHLFAYPNGSWSPQVRDLVVREHYSLAFVNSPGLWTAETDPWLIPRTNIWEGSITDIYGNFSRVAFEYSVFWRALRAEAKNRHAVTRRQTAPL
jgi:peptidoglycan/xylan/chitin deacetylase (PgdA/CDA1 family)